MKTYLVQVDCPVEATMGVKKGISYAKKVDYLLTDEEFGERVTEVSRAIGEILSVAGGQIDNTFSTGQIVFTAPDDCLADVRKLPHVARVTEHASHTAGPRFRPH